MKKIKVSKNTKKPRVVVAMSGGVDSSVTAALMVEAGYDVIGVTLQLYNHGQAVNRPNSCCAGRDIKDAREVASQLGIPYYVLNYEKRFLNSVIEDFADSYLRGETPIPCVRCNQTVKFSDLLQTAKKLGAEALATGHYVRRKELNHNIAMFRGRDLKKDQSYFLFSTTRAQLNYLRFPLGNMEKAETREYASRLGLTVSEKPESQDICFVPNGNYANIIGGLRPGAFKRGDIIDLDGQYLGQHTGIANFTIGQRRGLGIACGTPLYVVAIQPTENRIIVGPLESLLVKSFKIKQINWLGDKVPLNQEIQINVKVRSTTPPIPATLCLNGGGLGKIEYESPQTSTAAGQAAVFYENDRVLGGGWIS